MPCHDISISEPSAYFVAISPAYFTLGVGLSHVDQLFKRFVRVSLAENLDRLFIPNAKRALGVIALLVRGQIARLVQFALLRGDGGIQIDACAIAGTRECQVPIRFKVSAWSRSNFASSLRDSRCAPL